MITKDVAKLAVVSFGLLVLGLSTTMTATAPAFADNKDCNKNDNNNCNDTEKNQKLTPKVQCEIDTEIKDHNKNIIVGPFDLQCNSTNFNIRDSTIIESPLPNGDFESPTIVSTDPGDGDNNVPLDTDVKVTFDESIDEGSINSNDLTLFNLDGTIDPDVQDVSTSSKSATFTLQDQLLPGTDYEATISSDIQDQDGNFLDCFDSNGVDDSCSWQFTTSGTSLSPTITLNPTSGPVGTSVTITGTGFDPSSIVTITFDGNSVTTTPATVTTTNNGEFSATFSVPASALNGSHTVAATQGANSASKTFTVTSNSTTTQGSSPF